MPTSAAHLTARQRQVRTMRREALGRALANARKRAGLSQWQLADTSGVSRPTIVRLESGTSTISADRLWELAAACGTTASALFKEAEELDISDSEPPTTPS